MNLITFFTLVNALVALGAPGVERRDRTITITSTITRTITIYVTAQQEPSTVLATLTKGPSTNVALPTTDNQQLPPAPSSAPQPSDENPPNNEQPGNDLPPGESPVGQQPSNLPTNEQVPDAKPTGSSPSEGLPSTDNPSEEQTPVVSPPDEGAPVTPETNDYIPVVLPGSNPPLVIYLPNQEAASSGVQNSSPSAVQSGTSTASPDNVVTTSQRTQEPTSTPGRATVTTSETEGGVRTQTTLTTLPSITATFTQISTAPIETTIVTPEVSVTTISTTSGAVQILPSASTLTPSSEGTIMTSLNVTGAPTSAPVISTTISEPLTTISTSEVSSVVSTVVTDAPSVNVFVPIATDAPHGSIGRRADHPVPRLGIKQNSPIETNKFYGNFFLGSQTDPTWTHPYSMSWAKGRGSTWGLAISHVDRDQASFGPDGKTPAQYFVNPAGIQSIVLSASELGESTVLTTDSLSAFSANVNLAPSEGQTPAITFPVVQGMGFVTGIYNGGTPVINSGVLFRTLTKVDKQVKKGITKYQIVLEDGKKWLLYAASADKLDLDLQVVNNGMIRATSNFNGFIQIAKNPGSGEETFDEACGTYAESVELFGSVGGDVGSYTFKFRKSGIADSALLMFALPHHVESFSGATAADITNLKLVTTTKGTATGVLADYWTMTETLPTDMKFAPWSPETGSVDTLTEEAIAGIKDIAATEVSQDMDRQTNSDSMYFGGKALAKFAGVVYTLSELLDEKALGQAGLKQLKTAFGRFVNNQQQNPLVYETAWGGVVSTAAYVSGDSLADFGNTYYNDHHFHYGYHIYTAAVIAHLDPTVLEDNDFTSYVNTLLRDISNPSSADPYFPVQRAFDYYNGHSWAKGLFSSVDGKDQESTSEDMMHAYAIKAWGLATGDANIIARGNLQLAVTARSINNYFLYESDNTIQPSQIIGNKVSGILFENKIDHTTYFGTNIEYIQGIHMLPLLPCTALARSPRFVQEEWDTYFSNGRADNINSGWRGILYGNLMRSSPSTAWDFFVGNNGWSADWIDGGASRTWYLAFAAAMRDGPQASRSSESRLMSVSSVNETSIAGNQTVAANYKRSSTLHRGSVWSRLHLHKLHGH